MLRNFFLSFFLFPVFCSGQTFYDSTYTHIPDTSTILIPINVSGLPSQINSSFGLSSVCINITHSFDADLVIRLQSPDGSLITLAGGVGMNGQNFLNTCFAMNGSSFIASGTAPFTGTFIPQQSLNIKNNGQNPNGNWILWVSDTYFSDTGSYHNCSITFSVNPPADQPAPPIVCNYCSCQNISDTCDLFPDMTASALCIQQFHTEYTGYITLANATPNVGRGPLEAHGIDSCFCDTVPIPCNAPCAGQLKHIVVQKIYQRHGSDTLSSYNHTAGKMIFHPAHQHLHVDHWSDFSLRVQTSNADATTWPVVGNSTKQSFCLMNDDNCTADSGYCKDSLGNVLTLANIPNSGFGFYSGCGLDQGIYGGYLDIYDEALNDPIILNNICDGTYYIVSITNPEKSFLESDYSNNWAAVPITLTKQNSPSGTASFNYVQNGLQIIFTNTSLTGNTYLWNFGDGNWDTTYSPIHTYSAIGTYTVTLVSLNQCYTLTSQVVALTGINEYSQQGLNLRIYQNPITENSFITYYLPEKTFVKVSISDVLGKEIAVLLNEFQQMELQKYSLKNISLTKGIYFLNLITENRNTSVKFVVIR